MPNNHRELKILALSGISPMAHSTLTFRLLTFHKIGGYREKKSEDFDLILRLSLAGHLSNVEQEVALVRFGTPNSHTARYRPNGLTESHFVMRALSNTVKGCKDSNRTFRETTADLSSSTILGAKAQLSFQILAKHRTELSANMIRTLLKEFFSHATKIRPLSPSQRAIVLRQYEAIEQTLRKKSVIIPNL